VGFEPTTPAGERPQTYALDRAATGTSMMQYAQMNLTAELPWQKQHSTKDSFHQQTELKFKG